MRCPQRMRFERELYAFHESAVPVSDCTRLVHACEFSMQASAFLVAVCAHAIRCLRAAATCLLLTSFSFLSLADAPSFPDKRMLRLGVTCASQVLRLLHAYCRPSGAVQGPWGVSGRSSALVFAALGVELGYGVVGGAQAERRRAVLTCLFMPLWVAIYTKLSAACFSQLLRSYITLATQAYRLLPHTHTSHTQDQDLDDEEERQQTPPQREIATHPVPRTARLAQEICMRCAQYIGNVPHKANWQPCDVRNIGTVLMKKCWRCSAIHHDCDEVPDDLVPMVNRVFRASAAIEARVGDEDDDTVDAQDEEARVARAEFKSAAAAFSNNKNRMSGGTPTKRRKTAAAAPAFGARLAPHELEEVRLMRRGIGALVEIGRSYMVAHKLPVANVDRLMRSKTPEDDVPDE